jgi:hypothetical protein
MAAVATAPTELNYSRFLVHWFEELKKARDLFDAGDAEGCIEQCRKNLNCVHIEIWWSVANLLTAIEAKDEWDDEAQYFFTTAETAIDRHWPKNSKTQLWTTYQRLARQRREEGADVNPLPAYQPRGVKKGPCSCHKAAQEYAGGHRPLPEIGSLKSSFQGLLSRQASDQASDGTNDAAGLEAKHPVDDSPVTKSTHPGLEGAPEQRLIWRLEISKPEESRLKRRRTEPFNANPPKVTTRKRS